MLAQFDHLYHSHQHNGVLVALFQGGLRYLFGVAFVCAGANLELPYQLRIVVYQRTSFDKNKTVEDKNQLKRL